MIAYEIIIFIYLLGSKRVNVTFCWKRVNMSSGIVSLVKIVNVCDLYERRYSL